MKRVLYLFLPCVLFITLSIPAVAKENIGNRGKKSSGSEPVRRKLAAGCDPASNAVDLDINNVRARIMNGGDMWWDLVNNARYEIPKVTQSGGIRKHSLFAGALWIGGYNNNSLKEAGMTYRFNGASDFFPGPLDTNTVSIEYTDCKNWDQIWEITRKEIDDFRKDNSNISDAISKWPAHGLNGYDPEAMHSHFLAPFIDVDGDFRYHPENGDYPNVAGDQALWYVYNDMGNIHTETVAEAIGLELQTMAFAFTTNDEINNMTFYKTTIINRSGKRLDSTFFGQWVDADLGNYADDYVGCDTIRSLGICYNGDENDEGVFGYGSNPPSVGVDFFEGPNADVGDKKDNDRDGCIDCTLVPREDNPKIIDKVPDTELPEKWGMEYFVYYNNDVSDKGNPGAPEDYYHYLTGSWKNGDPILNGKDGFACPGCPRAKYMFPGDPRKSDEWSEVSAGNKPGDRRFLQSAGPFSLEPGAKNAVTVGVVWAKATTGGATGSLDQLKLADDKAQALYNDSFDIVDGPDAPDVTMRELDRKLVIALEDTKETERYKESIKNKDNKSITYRFQGYQIFQLKTATVTNAELSNPDRARLVAQVDLADEHSKLVNKVYDPEVGDYKKVVMVDGANEGLKHTFEITDDAFASGDKRLVNFKFYYYLVIAYAVADDPNEHVKYLPSRKAASGGQIKVYTGIPHRNNPEFGGTDLQSDYGYGPEIMRIEGMGNGNNIIDLSKATEEEILRTGHADKPVYAGGHGPVSVKIYDPTKIQNAQYELRMIDDTIKGSNPANNLLLSKGTRWKLTNLTTGETVIADTSIAFGNEQLIYSTEKVNGKEEKRSWGFSITVNHFSEPWHTRNFSMRNAYKDRNNGFMEATMRFEDESQRWLSGLADVDHNTNLGDKIPTPGNWIRAGKYGNAEKLNYAVEDMAVDTAPQIEAPPFDTGNVFVDPNQVYEGLLGGIIAPAALVARTLRGENNSPTLGLMPAIKSVSINSVRLQWTPNVDIVFTSDKSKWSECIVLEMGEDSSLNEGTMQKFQIRNHAGWMGETNAEGKPVYSADPDKRGKSLFPGYAINLETGDRLNMMFGEDSHLPSENGNDMIWNPTSTTINPAAGFLDVLSRYVWGGKHWIYVMNSVTPFNSAIKTRYDGCSKYYDIMRTSFDDPNKPSTGDQAKVFSNIAWVMAAMTAPDFKLNSVKEGIVPNDVRIRLRVSRPYTTYKPDNTVSENRNLPYYTFSTSNVSAVRSADAGKRALSMVGITPNPYYAGNQYEKSQLDSRVRIINLPTRCEVSIYTIDGTLVRRFTKDESHNTGLTYDGDYPTTYLDWDLKNQGGIPVSSGVYLIHVDGYELGETVMKWFGITKPIDLDTF
jgi:hypothetical protein